VINTTSDLSTTIGSYMLDARLNWRGTAGKARVGVSIAVDRGLAPHHLEPAWQLYTRAFDELRITAVERHVMYRDEFTEQMLDERVWKYRGVDLADPEAVLALATFTNDLSTMSFISLDYFEHRWPSLYSGQRIWYIGFFAIDPRHRGAGIFEEVIAHMWQTVIEADGVAFLDICGRNEELGLSGAIQHTLEGLMPGMRTSQLDTQTYWLYEPPAA
jgi:hypothetical protein